MYENILIPFDGTKEARKGAEHGIDLATSLGATIHALYVVDLPGAPRTVYIREDEEEMREEYHAYGEEVTSELCETAGEEGVECVAAVRSGTPSKQIVKYAEEEDMDAIVMGVAFRGKLQGLLGGTSDKVVRSSAVPVITHRMQIDE